MRLVRYLAPGGPRYGQLDGSDVLDVGADLWDRQPAIERVGTVEELRILAPLEPGLILCVGLDYRAHAAEAHLDVPDRPLLFAKAPRSVIGPNDAIPLHADLTGQVDFEAELAVIIGATASRIPTDAALDYVLGYTCLNDISARDLQSSDGQWVRAKSLDGFCPLGPVIVTPDDIPDPQNLRISCTVNGDTMQDASTADMIFGIQQLISFISQGITLNPGDVIATGTPQGVGVARTPPRFLTDGDKVSVHIDGIGQLVNDVTP